MAHFHMSICKPNAIHFSLFYIYLNWKMWMQNKTKKLEKKYRRRKEIIIDMSLDMILWFSWKILFRYKNQTNNKIDKKNKNIGFWCQMSIIIHFNLCMNNVYVSTSPLSTYSIPFVNVIYCFNIIMLFNI